MKEPKKMAFGNLGVHVTLIGKSADGKDDVVHASGDIELRIIVDAPLLSRNGHVYMFSDKDSTPRRAVFREVSQPYIVTEF